MRAAAAELAWAVPRLGAILALQDGVHLEIQEVAFAERDLAQHALDPQGNLYVADWANDRSARITTSS